MHPSLLLLLSFVCAPAFAGDVHGGGSNGVVAGFVSKARYALERYPGPHEEAAALRDALDDPNTRIVAVKVLLDPVTGKPIPNQEKNPAWGSPGLIQLKLDSGVPGEVSFEALLRDKRPAFHHVVHELFRASRLCPDLDARKCLDDEYKMTVLKYHLDRLPGDDSIAFPAAVPNVRMTRDEVMIANGPLQPARITNGILDLVEFTAADGRIIRVVKGGRDAARELGTANQGGASLALIGTHCAPESPAPGAALNCDSVRIDRGARPGDPQAPESSPESGNAI